MQIPQVIWVSWLSLLYSFGVILVSFGGSGELRGPEIFRFFYKLSFLAGFIGITYWVLARFGSQLILTSLKVCAVIGGILSLVLHSGQNFPGLEGRLNPFGLLCHPILGGSVYGMVGLICFYQAFLKKTSRQLLLNLGIFGLCSCVVFFTMSRGPLLSYGVSLGGVIGYHLLIHPQKVPRQMRFIFCGLMGLAVGLTVFMSYFADDFILISLWQKRESYRLYIWLEAWRYIQAVLPWGAGYKNELTIVLTEKAHVNHLHNLFLSKLYREGVVGIVFLITILSLSIQKMSKIWRTNLGGLASILFIHGVFSCVTDTSSFWDGKNFEMFLFFWFPLIFVASIRDDAHVNQSHR
ncbi:MAG TPA: O-antigen ligase family protein [Candidatus Nitrosotenuis sp.]|nr:O-antigen ligase family protein [Candidatus Nitrosotenuis sp.]